MIQQYKNSIAIASRGTFRDLFLETKADLDHDHDHGFLGALGLAFLGLPVVVAGTLLPVAVGSRRDAEALLAALVAEEQARLPVMSRRAPVVAGCRAL